MLAMFSGLLLVSRIPIAKASESQRSCVPCRRCRQYGELRRQLQYRILRTLKQSFSTASVFISGASLPAFVKLGKKKGYRLVGCQGYGFNAFFVRNDVGQDIFTEVPAERCFSHPFASWAHDELLPMVKNREWQQV